MHTEPIDTFAVGRRPVAEILRDLEGRARAGMPFAAVFVVYRTRVDTMYTPRTATWEWRVNGLICTREAAAAAIEQGRREWDTRNG